MANVVISCMISTRVLAIAAAGLSLTTSSLVVSAAAHAGGLRECGGLDYVAVKHISCAKAKRVVQEALDASYADDDGVVLVEGFTCSFLDSYSMKCVRRSDGTKQVIKYEGD